MSYKPNKQTIIEDFEKMYKMIVAFIVDENETDMVELDLRYIQNLKYLEENLK